MPPVSETPPSPRPALTHHSLPIQPLRHRPPVHHAPPAPPRPPASQERVVPHHPPQQRRRPVPLGTPLRPPQQRPSPRRLRPHSHHLQRPCEEEHLPLQRRPDGHQAAWRRHVLPLAQYRQQGRRRDDLQAEFTHDQGDKGRQAGGKGKGTAEGSEEGKGQLSAGETGGYGGYCEGLEDRQAERGCRWRVIIGRDVTCMFLSSLAFDAVHYHPFLVSHTSRQPPARLKGLYCNSHSSKKRGILIRQLSQ